MGDAQLRGWKQIAEFLGTSPRTAQRWEAEFSLPVHRLGSGRRASVFAHRDELAVWLESKPAAAGAAEDRAPAGEEETPALAGASGEDGNAAPAAANLADLPVKPALAAGEAEEATSSPARAIRPSWRMRSVASAALVVVVVLGVSLALVLRQPSSGAQARVAAAPSDERPILFFKLTSRNGDQNTVAIPDGARARVTWGGRELQFSARLASDVVRLSVAELSGADAGTQTPVPIGSMTLRRGARATLEMPVPLTIEWVDVRLPHARSAGRP